MVASGMRRLAPALLASMLAVSAAAAAQGWRVYANPRFGTRAEVPADWRPGPEPENGDGLAFTSPDGAATLTVWGGLHIDDTVAEALDRLEAREAGETVTYRRRGPRSVVLSGRRGERIFYRKSILSCRDTIWHSLSIEYPADRKAAFDPLVTQIAGSLKQGPGLQADRCR